MRTSTSIEARRCEPGLQLLRVDRVVGVALVERDASPPCSRRRPPRGGPRARAPGPARRRPGPAGRRGDVVEHVERGRPGEAVVGEVERGRIPDHHLDVPAARPLGQGRRQPLVDLHRGEMGRHGAQDVGREPGPGPDLDRVVTQRDAVQRHRAGSSSCTILRQSSLAQNTMCSVFTPRRAAHPGAWTWYSSFHQRAARTSSGSVRSAGSWPRSAGVGPIRSAMVRSASRSKP